MCIRILQPATQRAEGETGFTGYYYNDLVNGGDRIYHYLFGQEEPPKRGTEPFQYETECSEMEISRKHQISHCPGITEIM